MTVRNSVKFALAAPLALVLAACGGEADGDLEGDVIAPIEAPEGGAWLDTVTVSESDGYILGNPDAPIKLIEYASHTCGGCATFSATAKPSIKKYVETGVVSFEQRNLVRDPIDLSIAALVRCGAKENMQVLSDEAWQNLGTIQQALQTNGEALAAANNLPVEQKFVAFAEISGLIDFFAARGISGDQARSCLSDVELLTKLQDNSRDQGQEFNIQATPSFLLNGRKLDGIGWEDVEGALQRAGARTAAE